MASGLSDGEKQVAYLKELFNYFDKNGDGAISREELDTVMKSLGKTLSDEEIKAIISTVDANKNGSIEFQEFLSMLNHMMEKGY